MRFYVALFVFVFALVPLGVNSARAETEPPFIPQPQNPAFVVASNTPTEREPLIYPAIVGGEVTQPGDWPWQVFVLVHHEELSPTSYVFCGGSLIADNWVLTAAHCLTMHNTSGLTYMQPGDVQVRIAEYNIYLYDGAEQTISAAEVIPHPDYNPITSDSDLALIHLSEAADLGDNAALIPMLASPDDDALAVPSTVAMTTGWGATGTDDSPSPELREVDVPIITNAACDFIFANDITSNMICAGYGPDGPEKDSCYGDSGGPLVVPDGAGGWKLVGITSFGPQECASAYGVYTRVSEFTDWIYDAMIDSSIDSFSPTSGPAGTQVAIFGSGFTGAQQVQFNGASAEFTVNSDSSITAAVPENATTGTIKVVQSLFGIESTSPYTMAYPLNIAAVGVGDGTVQFVSGSIICEMGSECSNNYIDGTSVGLHALNGADTEHIFAGWKGDCSGSDEWCTVQVDSSKIVTAVFSTATPTLTVATASVNGGKGHVESSSGGINTADTSEVKYDLGTTVSLTAIADDGSRFLRWSGACSGQDPVCTVQMIEPSTVEAVFGPSYYTISVELSGHGAGQVTSFPAGIDSGSNYSSDFIYGTTVNLTAIAASGSVFNGWDGACSGMNNTCVVTADAAKTAIANFESDLVFLPGLLGRPAVMQ